MGLTPQPAVRSEQTEKRSPLLVVMLGLLFIGWIGEWPLDFDGVSYMGLWRSPLVVFAPFLAPVPGMGLSPWQILLIALSPFCLGSPGTVRQHAREMDRAILISLGCLAVTFLWGTARGGTPHFAYYQVWRLLAALLIGYMLMSLLHTQRDLAILGKVVVFAALIRATVCIYYFWTHLYGKVYPLPPWVTNHDDSMLFVVGILIVSLWTFLKGGRATWTVAAPVVLVLLLAMALNNRRIAWVELASALLLIYALLGPGPLRSRINRWLMIAAPLLLVYIAVGSGSDSALFAPVHALTTTGSNYDPSSLARKEEVRNLLRTLDQGNPLLGTGWGVPYDKVESFYANYDARWALYLYTPHNSILGLAAFSGLVGVIGIWGVVPTAAYLAARGYRGSIDPVQRTAGMVALCSLAVFSAHCYGDLGLQSFQGVLVLGAALATAGKVAAWSAALPAAQAVPARAGGRRRAPETQPAYRQTPVGGARSDSLPPRSGPSGRPSTRRLSR
ncbi:MAG TPA: O-antigen ligase family protein [Candidatus Margulisiibacteriota bacterium]|nr:O-antigen ligase family protein [Candidatus Margulisiibacteriota bacterium]